MPPPTRMVRSSSFQLLKQTSNPAQVGFFYFAYYGKIIIQGTNILVVMNVMFLESMLVFLAPVLKKYIRLLINLVIVLGTRLYCENRKNIAYDIKNPRPKPGLKNVMFFNERSYSSRSYEKNYIRFLINLVIVLGTRLYCENRKNIAYDIFSTIKLTLKEN